MKVEETKLKGCYIIQDTLFQDERGYFFESFNQKKFEDLTGNTTNFIQDNQSKSSFGVLRGIHFQTGEFAQAKLVRVLSGSVLDVVVDLRNDSETFGKCFSIELSDSNHKQLFIPRGFGHAFIVISKEAVFFYKCDNLYNKSAEGGINYKDPIFDINWNIPNEQIIVSSKDKTLPFFNPEINYF